MSVARSRTKVPRPGVARDDAFVGEQAEREAHGVPGHLVAVAKPLLGGDLVP